MHTDNWYRTRNWHLYNSSKACEFCSVSRSTIHAEPVESGIQLRHQYDTYLLIFFWTVSNSILQRPKRMDNVLYGMCVFLICLCAASPCESDNILLEAGRAQTLYPTSSISSHETPVVTAELVNMHIVREHEGENTVPVVVGTLVSQRPQTV